MVQHSFFSVDHQMRMALINGILIIMQGRGFFKEFPLLLFILRDLDF
jgi:hypothetical protein